MPRGTATKQKSTSTTTRPSGGSRPRNSWQGERGGGRRRMGSRSSSRPRSEFDQKVISIRRVTRVVAGGRRFGFSAVLVLGDKKGRVGVGIGKGSDTAVAIEKAVRNAKKNMKNITLLDSMSIKHEVKAKYGSAKVGIIPAPGKGLVAGSSVRTVLGLAGVTDVTAKINSRSKNKLNNARVAVKALLQLG